MFFKIFNRFSLNVTKIGSEQKFFSQMYRNLPVANNFSMRSLRIFEFKEILNTWAEKEGWNPGKYEYLPFYLASINGHKGLFLNDRIIASLSAVRYSKDFAFLGIYIVDPKYRAQGLGQILAQSVLEELEDCSLIGINAVQQQVSNYQRKYGFMPFHLNSRWVGEFKIQNNFTLRSSEVDIKIIGREGLSINELIDYDARIFSVPREKFLRKWIEMPESCLLTAIKKQKICGYGVLSKCKDGYKVAPLFADDEEIAKRLYASFASILQEKQNSVQLDIPENNPAAVKLAEQSGLLKKIVTTRMFKEKPPELYKEKPPKQLNNDKVYASTTLELG
jgi:GNAT superfamily N-acetyltransferase